jgi:hypothetical protein
MAHKLPVLSLIFCLILSSGVISCKKDETQPTLSSKVTGKWKQVRYATDDNANGVLDDWEVHEVVTDITNILDFKNDGTGVEYTTGNPDLPFGWGLTSELSLAFSYKSSDTILYKITRVNSANLHLTTRTKNGLAGYYYDKTK